METTEKNVWQLVDEIGTKLTEAIEASGYIDRDPDFAELYLIDIKDLVNKLKSKLIQIQRKSNQLE